ncbi:MAG TPA: hypothetical protein EYN70_07380 [Planctomycetaceae bacterium]|nr:hypothetical protein [Planctomycetaceae bacterium]
MFDQPEKYLSRFAFHGRLKNGDTVDLLRNQVRDRDNPYPESADSFPTQRWMILSRELTASHNFVFRLHVARYLSHQWNQTHSESEQILDGELVAYFDNKSEDFYSIRRQSLAIVDMRDSGPIRFGRRHGKWILRYDNGRKYGEGRYKMGQESGHWIYWNEAGNRDLEGSYVKGRKQGKWTSWEADGRVNRGIYRDDELIRILP